MPLTTSAHYRYTNNRHTWYLPVGFRSLNRTPGYFHLSIRRRRARRNSRCTRQSRRRRRLHDCLLATSAATTGGSGCRGTGTPSPEARRSQSWSPERVEEVVGGRTRCMERKEACVDVYGSGMKERRITHFGAGLGGRSATTRAGFGSQFGVLHLKIKAPLCQWK